MARERDYSKEKAYNSSPKQKKDNAARKRARYAMEKAGKAHKGDGKEIDHIKPIAKGGGNQISNLRSVSPSKNRSFPRTKSAKMK
jgi:5-methylcytosine-specific restriction endonuclease McrA